MRPSNYVFAILALALLGAGLLFGFIHDGDLGLSQRFGWPLRQPASPASETIPQKVEPASDKPSETTIYKMRKDTSRLSIDGDRQSFTPWFVRPDSAPAVDRQSVREAGKWLLDIMGVLALLIQLGAWIVNFGQWARGTA